MPRNGFSLLDIVRSLKLDKHFLSMICLILFKKIYYIILLLLNIKLSYIFNAYYKGLKKKSYIAILYYLTSD